jgi:hypothetical protein
MVRAMKCGIGLTLSSFNVKENCAYPKEMILNLYSSCGADTR